MYQTIKAFVKIRFSFCYSNVSTIHPVFQLRINRVAWSHILNLLLIRLKQPKNAKEIESQTALRNQLQIAHILYTSWDLVSCETCNKIYRFGLHRFYRKYTGSVCELILFYSDWYKFQWANITWCILLYSQSSIDT